VNRTAKYSRSKAKPCYGNDYPTLQNLNLSEQNVQ